MAVHGIVKKDDFSRFVQYYKPKLSEIDERRKMKPIYKRVLIKISGEGLMGEEGFGISAEAVKKVAEQIKQVVDAGIEVCLVVGGGNIFRGVQGASKGLSRTVGDHVGMMATVMNALYLQNVMEGLGLSVRVMSGLEIPQVCENYIYRRALRHLQKGRVVIFAGGTGSPYFTTDTGAVLRASEMGCEVLLKSTQVDGVYDDDPRKNPKAKKYKQVSYNEVIEKQLRVMDLPAIAMARDNKLPILVFSQHEKGALMKVLAGKGNFTIIKES